MKKSLYVKRDLINPQELIEHFAKLGAPKLEDNLHCTVCYSSTPVEWEYFTPLMDKTPVPYADRKISLLGDNMLVLEFESGKLTKDHDRFIRLGASWDYPSYRPHISLFKSDFPRMFQFQPFLGPLILGPEIFEEIKED